MEIVCIIHCLLLTICVCTDRVVFLCLHSFEEAKEKADIDTQIKDAAKKIVTEGAKGGRKKAVGLVKVWNSPVRKN